MKKILFPFVIIFVLVEANAQIWNTTITNIDAHPAYTGLEGKSNLNFSRNTAHTAMSAITPGYEKILMAYDMPLYFSKDNKESYLGIGFAWENNQIESEKRSQFSLPIAYHYSFGGDSSKHKLSFGISPSIYSYKINATNLYFTSQYNPTTQAYNQAVSSGESFITDKISFDLGLGTWYSYKNFLVGVSLLHLTKPNINSLASSGESERLPMTFNTIIQYSIKIGANSLISVLEFNKRGIFSTLSPQILFEIKQVVMVGIEYKYLNTPSIKVGVNLYKHLRLYAGAGLFLKQPPTNFGTGIEMGLRYQFNPYKQ